MDVDSSVTPNSDQLTDGTTNISAQLDESEQSVPASVPTASPPVQLPEKKDPTVGPRPAPIYSVVNTIVENKEDGPGPRCGHTLTAVPPVGEEGTPGFIGPRLLLFGGATALEGNTAPSGPPVSPGGSGISMSNPFVFLLSWFL